jgi:hypothetical protein
MFLFNSKYLEDYNQKYSFIHIFSGIYLLYLQKQNEKNKKKIKKNKNTKNNSKNLEKTNKFESFLSFIILYQSSQYFFDFRFFIDKLIIKKGNSLQHTLYKISEYILGYIIGLILYIKK